MLSVLESWIQAQIKLALKINFLSYVKDILEIRGKDLVKLRFGHEGMALPK